jgi:hypothetical protein
MFGMTNHVGFEPDQPRQSTTQIMKRVDAMYLATLVSKSIGIVELDRATREEPRIVERRAEVRKYDFGFVL